MLYELCARKRWDEAFRLQRTMWEVNRVFQKYNLAACVKAGLELQGFTVGNPIAPNQPLGKEAREEVGHVDVYKRQGYDRPERPFKKNGTGH